jgi:hypothetical protein
MNHQTRSPLEAYHELSYYTLSLGDPSFIHQHIVDAYAAQYADETTKPITLAFALIGLYLHIERDFTGREVQKVHMRLAQTKKAWPAFGFPLQRGSITVFDVLRAKPGKSRDRAIENWSRSVWEAWRSSHAKVGKLVHSELGSASSPSRR